MPGVKNLDDGLSAITADIAAIKAETDKIDLAAADGLTGVENSNSYRANEIDRHVHHYSRVLGLAATPDAELHRADEQTSDPAPFVVDAGNDTWGAWLQLLGSDDTPVISGKANYDAHLVSIVGAETANVTYQIQVSAGATGAAGLSAGTYSGKTFRPQSAQGRPAAIPVGIRRQAAGTKLWIRTLARGQNTATLDLYLEIHEYEG